MGCKVCEHPKGAEMTAAILRGAITIAEAARAMTLPYNDVWYHVQNCVADEPVEEVDETGNDDIKMLRYIIRQLKRLVNEVSVLPANEASRSLPQLVRELRGCITDIAALEGRLQNTTIVQVSLLQNQLSQIRDSMVSELCPVCQAKILSIIEEGKKLATK